MSVLNFKGSFSFIFISFYALNCSFLLYSLLLQAVLSLLRMHLSINECFLQKFFSCKSRQWILSYIIFLASLTITLNDCFKVGFRPKWPLIHSDYVET